MIGKWHLHPAPDLLGFHEAHYTHNLQRQYGQTFYDLEGGRQTVDGFSLDFELDQAGRFLRKHKDRPFFLHYNISLPHYPLCEAPASYVNRYSREQVILRENVFRDGAMAYDPKWIPIYMWAYLAYLPENLSGDEAEMTENYARRISERPLHGLKRFYRDIHGLMETEPALGDTLIKALPYLDQEAMRRADLIDVYRWYYGMVHCVDHYLGGLMELLAGEGLEEDTILLFASDHGDQLGSHHLWNKGYLYEESIRIPLMFRWPGRLNSARIGRQVGSLIDIMPTLLSLAGLPVPEAVQGRDLSPVLRGDREALAVDGAFIEAYSHNAVGLRTPDALYGLPLEGAPEQAAGCGSDGAMHFDLRSDPLEQCNLGGDSEAPFEELRRWHRQTPWLPVAPD